MAEVYALKCPITEEYRYIGSTVGTGKRRLKQHMNRPCVVKWWADALFDDSYLKPILVILHKCDSIGEALHVEHDLIEKHAATLLNVRLKPRINHANSDVKIADLDDRKIIDDYDWLKWWKSKVINDAVAEFYRVYPKHVS